MARCLTPYRRGHAIECRICAEDPSRGFLPTAGTVLRLEHPGGPGIRVDSSLYEGLEIPVAYDSLLTKVVAWGPDREHARRRMLAALERFVLLGVRTNIEFLAEILSSDAFKAGAFTTSILDRRDSAMTSGNTAKDARDESFPIVTAAAALAASGGGTVVKGAAARSTPGPWERLGGWRLGGGSRS